MLSAINYVWQVGNVPTNFSQIEYHKVTLDYADKGYMNQYVSFYIANHYVLTFRVYYEYIDFQMVVLVNV